MTVSNLSQLVLCYAHHHCRGMANSILFLCRPSPASTCSTGGFVGFKHVCQSRRWLCWAIASCPRFGSLVLAVGLVELVLAERFVRPEASAHGMSIQVGFLVVTFEVSFKSSTLTLNIMSGVSGCAPCLSGDEFSKGETWEIGEPRRCGGGLSLRKESAEDWTPDSATLLWIYDEQVQTPLL